ncbi:hypothetical protein CK500_14555 [Halorubrum salipaludis]|uniref:Uncharacterized protein n=1 Tax=Halorubrum salipaludis TaxID=2032630 RepID=A0A2A2F9V7_9EURY|nr:hypothetical protein [Halorubrum salipaludis]PAU81514.1 hypothetical protein CK500_14555 [Halorubrum salipaludis]
MRIPVPNNRLVAFTLAGALLTTVVAGGLAFPGIGLGQPADSVSDDTNGAQQVGADAPTPNQDFTPAVQTQSGYDEDREEEYEEHEDGESEDNEEEHEDHEEYEEED